MTSPYQKCALITGVNGGIGSALCQAFKEQGYKVIGLGRKAEPTTDCDYYISLNLDDFCLDYDGHGRLYSQVYEYLKSNDLALFALINNAAYQVVKPLDQLSIDDFESTIHANVLAPFLLTKIFHKELRASKGSVVNIGSVHSRLTKPGFCAYSTSKSALSGLTRALALELAPDVNVNTVSPAATATAMLKDGFKDHPDEFQKLEACHPMERVADPMEVAKVVLFLCSQDSSFLTGGDVAVDGGIGGRLHDPV